MKKYILLILLNLVLATHAATSITVTSKSTVTNIVASMLGFNPTNGIYTNINSIVTNVVTSMLSYNPTNGEYTTNMYIDGALNASNIFTGSITVTNTITASNHWDSSNVKWWGAKGDGNTDDAPAIQACIDSLTNSGGTVYFPVGTFKIGSTLRINTGPSAYYTGLNIQGAGIAGTTITMTNLTQPAIELDGVRWSHFSGFLLAASAGSTGHGIVLTNVCIHNVFENFEVYGFGGTGIFFAGGAAHPPDGQYGNVFRQGWLSTCGTGIGSLTDENGIISLGPSMEIQSNTIGVKLKGVNQFIFENVIEGNGDGIWLEPTNQAINNVSIFRNHFEANINSDIYLSGNAASPSLEGLYVTENYFQDVGTRYSITNTGINLVGFVWQKNTTASNPIIKTGSMQNTPTTYGYQPSWFIEGDLTTWWELGVIRPTQTIHYSSVLNAVVSGFGASVFDLPYEVTIGRYVAGVGIGPDRSEYYDIGESTNRFRAIYTKTIEGVNNMSVGSLSTNTTAALTLRTSGSSTVLRMDSDSTNANSRNWALVAGSQDYGDFSIKESISLYGDPWALPTSIDRLYFSRSGGNIGIGATAFGTSATMTLAITNGTPPSTSPANMIQLNAYDVSASSELFVRNELGQVTQLSGEANFPTNITVGGTNTAAYFVGDGSLLTGLTNITSGLTNFIGSEVIFKVALVSNTNIITLPFTPQSGDLAYFYAWWDTGDTNPIYGNTMSSYTAGGAQISSNHITESYNPAVSETLVFYLTTNTATMAVTFFGTNLTGKWRDAYLEISRTNTFIAKNVMGAFSGNGAGLTNLTFIGNGIGLTNIGAESLTGNLTNWFNLNTNEVIAAVQGYAGNLTITNTITASNGLFYSGLIIQDDDLVTQHGGSNMCYLSYDANTNSIIAGRDVNGNWATWIASSGPSRVTNTFWAAGGYMGKTNQPGLDATIDVLVAGGTTNRTVYSGGILISNIPNYWP